MIAKYSTLLISTVIGGLSMWVVAGLWHNLILPLFNANIQAHHEGLGLMLLAYLILSFLMAYMYSLVYHDGGSIIGGLKIGMLIGILWVFPHGLAMAGAHNTSIVYEIQNALWHIVEQGIGGIIISAIVVKRKNNQSAT